MNNTTSKILLGSTILILVTLIFSCGGPNKYSVEAVNEAGPVYVCFKGNQDAKILKWGVSSITDVTQYSGTNFELLSKGETKKWESIEAAMVFLVISNYTALTNTNEVFWWAMHRADTMLPLVYNYPRLIKFRITERGLEKPEITK